MPTYANRRAILPCVLENRPQWQRGFQTWLLQANTGNINCTGRVTLTPGQNATTVTDARAGVASFIGFMPLTANAAVEKAGMAVTSQGAGLFVIEHANNAIVDRTYTYAIMG